MIVGEEEIRGIERPERMRAKVLKIAGTYLIQKAASDMIDHELIAEFLKSPVTKPCSIVGYISGPIEKELVDYLKERQWEDVKCDFWCKYGGDCLILKNQAIVYFFPSLLNCIFKNIKNQSLISERLFELLLSFVDANVDDIDIDENLFSIMLKNYSSGQLSITADCMNYLGDKFSIRYSVNNIKKVSNYLLEGGYGNKSHTDISHMIKTKVSDIPGYYAWLEANKELIGQEDAKIFGGLELEHPRNVELTVDDVNRLAEELM